MLQSLHIKNIVLIENLELEFKGGFTSLTGETGAGKSIILSSLGLLLGNKADASILRFGAASGEVTGEFQNNKNISQLLADNEIESDELVIRRKISADGKSKAFINDTPVSLKLLEELGRNLVEIHGQRDQSTLLDQSKQRELLDKYASLSTELENLAAKFEEWKKSERELTERRSKIDEAKREEDYLRHVLEELNEFDAKPGEEEELSDRRRAAMDFEKTAKILSEAFGELTKDKNVDSAIISAQKILVRANVPAFAAAIESLEKASIEIGEAFSELERLGENVDTDPDKIAIIEERLFKIRELSRKYARPADQLHIFKDEIAQKLSLIKNEEGGIKQLAADTKKLEAEYLEIASAISAKRKEFAKKMEHKLSAELKPLAMAGTKFQIKFEAQAPNSKGIDKIEFLAATNPGMPLSSLASVASGGEISRFMLGLKVVLLGASSAPTIIFDEIDTGTGGSVAAAIGERLAKLGKELQVFVVTHLPQVAALAGNHLKVSKRISNKTNVTEVMELDAKSRKEELARMLAGSEITDEARAAAGKLLA